MNRAVTLIRLIPLAAALAAPASVAVAQGQQPQPRREDNIWGGSAHQPTEGNVLQEEKATGIAPPQQQQKAVDQDVEQMFQNLMTDTTPGKPATP